jgi:hypothetical protein
MLSLAVALLDTKAVGSIPNVLISMSVLVLPVVDCQHVPMKLISTAAPALLAGKEAVMMLCALTLMNVQAPGLAL